MVGSPAPGGPSRRNDWTQALREAAPYLGIGTAFAASVLLGLGFGYWLDKRFGTQPWLLLLGAGFGLFAGFYQFAKTVGRRNNEKR
jgi:ATP synthase protein I